MPLLVACHGPWFKLVDRSMSKPQRTAVRPESVERRKRFSLSMNVSFSFSMNSATLADRHWRQLGKMCQGPGKLPPKIVPKNRQIQLQKASESDLRQSTPQKAIIGQGLPSPILQFFRAVAEQRGGSWLSTTSRAELCRLSAAAQYRCGPIDEVRVSDPA